MQLALFFFEYQDNLRLVHLNPLTPKISMTEKFFRDDGLQIKKIQEGFALVHT